MTKNIIIAKRSRRETTVQLLVPIILMIALWMLSFAYDSNKRFSESQQTLRTPGAEGIGLYPTCISGRQTLGPCISLAWAITNETTLSSGAVDLVTRVVDRIRSENGLPGGQIRKFTTEMEMDAYILAHPNSTQGAYVFEVREPAVPTPGVVVEHVGYKIQYNQTAQTAYGLQINLEERTLLPMTWAVEKALLAELGSQVYTGAGTFDDALSYNLQTLQFARPEEFDDDLISWAGPTFIFSALMFNFVVLLSNVVTEKENHLREAMRIMGLKTLPYWLSWAITSFAFNIISVIMVVIFGSLFQFRFFLENDPRTYLFLFILFAFSLVPVSLLLSLAVKKASTATSIGFLLFLAGTLASIFSEIVYGPAAKGTIYPTVFSLFPPVIFTKGMQDISSFSDSTDEDGMEWSQRSTSSEFPLTFAYNWLIADFFIYSILLWYFDAIVSAQGKNVPFYFFLQPSYWGFHCLKEKNQDYEPSQRELDELGTFGAADVDDPNVLSEVDDAKNGTGAFAHTDGGLRIYGIHKAFVSRDMCCLRKNVFVANREVVVAVEPNSCLALLGHNGAGKSTLFNQLTGLLKPTHGDALVLGKSIKYQMDEIRSLIGVCPQHDILWDELTAREHVRLYAQLKDLDPAVIEDEVETRLADVGLTAEGDTAAGAFSGGMMRRLSCALAFTGDPSCVFLDEPTTGMDPVSKRQVWDMIEEQKKDRVIILTTHSMEEADVLASKISILSRGRFCTIGTANYLKARYGTGTRITIIPDETPRARQQILDFVAENLDGLGPDGDTDAGDLIFLVPTESRPLLASFFKKFERSKSDLGARDVIVSVTALEDVFLRVAELDDERVGGHDDSSA